MATARWGNEQPGRRRFDESTEPCRQTNQRICISYQQKIQNAAQRVSRPAEYEWYTNMVLFFDSIINVPGIIMARQMPYFALEIENWSYMPDCKSSPIEITFELYHKVLSLKRLYDQHGPK